jgi:hypothetical protein
MEGRDGISSVTPLPPCTVLRRASLGVVIFFLSLQAERNDTVVAPGANLCVRARTALLHPHSQHPRDSHLLPYQSQRHYYRVGTSNRGAEGERLLSPQGPEVFYVLLSPPTASFSARAREEKDGSRSRN